ncbi:RloB family protein [Chryseobacterium sp. 5_R23647]|uniref:RloB family protein n=1 Tax=Chryseobacterium sp. 5_R23647 TaxID=2258964 RepID=UPI000E23EE74|nr:RloB family protein [Chryseobacterium sp. 5_R23647]REC42973.1 RloB domain-containing protein [Chryseobacterium sp. 5_R23647]
MKKAVAVIGEGITEKYYIESLKGKAPFDIKPNSLDRNASSINKLEEAIKKAIKDGYDEVYCLIDMDGKNSGVSKTKYLTIKAKYHDKIFSIKKSGISCKVIFIETERCTELWFLYHFLKSSTTKQYGNYKQLENDLKKFRPKYEKTNAYYKSLKGGLFNDLQENSGDLDTAVKNSKDSIVSKIRDNRDYTYSEVHIMLMGLGLISPD